MAYDEIKKENRRRINAYTPEANSGTVDFFPAYIQLEQTNRCNAQCIMCNHFYLGNRGAEDIQPIVIEKIESILPYCEILMLNGDGEPFLSRDIERTVDRYASFNVKIGCNTNLSVIPNALWRLLSTAFGFLNISCDGASRETYELIRKGLSYDRFLDNLLRLNEEAPLLRKNLDCVLMKENVDEIVPLVHFAAGQAFNSIRFHRMGVNPCIGNQADVDLAFENRAAIQLAEAHLAAEELGIELQHPGYQLYGMEPEPENAAISDFRALIEERQKTSKMRYGHLSLANDYFSIPTNTEDFSVGIWDAGRYCQWAIERCYIDYKGNISTCCFNMKKNMGSLLEHSFEEIWNGESYSAMRRIMANNQLPNFCRECNWIKEPVF